MRPVAFVEDWFSVRQFPDHVISAEEEPVGHEAYLVGNGCRSDDDYATASTANSDWYLQVLCDRLRACNMVALDRGHNLAGLPIQIRLSCDGFVTSSWTALNVTIPAASGVGSIDDPQGVLTPEGAWLKRFDVEAATGARIFIPAMGSGLAPKIIRAQLGLALQLDAPPMDGAPLPENVTDLMFAEARSAAGWQGAGNIGIGRAVEFSVRLDSELAHDLVSYHLEGHYGLRRPMWWIPDYEQGERAICVIRPQGRMGFAKDANWIAGARATIAGQEHEPVAV